MYDEIFDDNFRHPCEIAGCKYYCKRLVPQCDYNPGDPIRIINRDRPCGFLELEVIDEN